MNPYILLSSYMNFNSVTRQCVLLRHFLTNWYVTKIRATMMQRGDAVKLIFGLLAPPVMFDIACAFRNTDGKSHDVFNNDCFIHFQSHNVAFNIFQVMDLLL